MRVLHSKLSRHLLVAGTALSSLICLGTGTAALAADTSSSPAQVEEVIVTAQKKSENIQNVPVSIQAFSAKMISDLGLKSSTDLAAVTPNVDIALPAGPGNQPIITIRGIGLNDYDTNNAGPNGIYVDEVYLSSPASQTFQTFDLERIEVLKGPQGTLYGRNSSGGAVNFISEKPSDTFKADLHAEYSSFNTVNLEGGVGGPITDKLDYRAALVVNESEGYVKNDLTGNMENGANNAATRLALLWKPTDKLKVLFNVHGGFVDNRPAEYLHIGDLDPSTGAQCSIAAAYAGGCVDAFGYGTPKDFLHGAYNRQKHLKVNSLGSYLRADYETNGLTWTSISSVEHNDKIHPEDSDASPNRLLEIDFGVRSNTFTQEFRVAHSDDRLDWVGGVYYLHEDLKQNQPIYLFLDLDKFVGAGGGDGSAAIGTDHSAQTTDAEAIFGQANYAVTDKLKLTLGGRYTDEQRDFHYVGGILVQSGGMDHFAPETLLADSHQSLSKGAFSWRVAADYHFTKDVHAYASAATGFKSGDFNGSFLSTSPAEIALQLKPVQPETVTTYEAGLKSSLFDNRLVIDLAAFYNEYEKLQVFVLVPPVSGGTGLPVNVLDNARRAHTDGLDAEVIARPFPNLTAHFNLGLLETRLDDFISSVDPSQPNFTGNQLPLSPHTSFSGILDYTHPVGEGVLDLQFNATFKSHQFFDISNDRYTTQDGYWLENLRVAYRFHQEKWEVAAFARNLADKHYLLDAFDLTNPFGFIQGIRGMPRTVGIEANFRY